MKINLIPQSLQSKISFVKAEFYYWRRTSKLCRLLLFLWNRFKGLFRKLKYRNIISERIKEQEEIYCLLRYLELAKKNNQTQNKL